LEIIPWHSLGSYFQPLVTASQLELRQTLPVWECVLLGIEFLIFACKRHSLFRSGMYLKTSDLARSAAKIGSSIVVL
jgi:hypothetical protein